VGGPILKTSCSTLGTYQGNPGSARHRLVASRFSPTAAERNGDFSAPGSTSKTRIQACISGNIIPASQLNPVSSVLLKSIPTAPAADHRLTYTGPSLVQNDDQFPYQSELAARQDQLSGQLLLARFNEPPDIKQIAKTNIIAADSSGISSRSKPALMTLTRCHPR